MITSLAEMVKQAPEAAAPLTTTLRTVLSPWSIGSVFTSAPDWVYPSIVARAVSAGRGVARAIVCGPLPAMLNATVSPPAALLASMIAWRRDPAPESAVDVTVKVAPRPPAAIPMAINPTRIRVRTPTSSRKEGGILSNCAAPLHGRPRPQGN